MTIEHIQFTMEPWHYSETPVRVLKMRIYVDGQVYFVERHLPPDDLESYFDMYFDAMRDTLKVVLHRSAAEADGDFCSCKVFQPDPNITVVVCKNCSKPLPGWGVRVSASRRKG